jgi:hypothetical protein
LLNSKINCHGASLEEVKIFFAHSIQLKCFSKSSETDLSKSKFLDVLTDNFIQTAEPQGGHHFKAATVNPKPSDFK